MYFKNTLKKFFVKDGSYDLCWLFIGLIFLFSFALIKMSDWIWLTTLGFTILSSAIFRYITTDSIFYDELLKIKEKKEIISYIFSKNIFTILFLVFFVMILSIILYMFGRMSTSVITNIDINVIAQQLFYVLGTENVILLFSNKPVKSYKKGVKRNLNDDISIGLDNYRSMIPSVVSNIIFNIILFYFNTNLNIYTAVAYYVICISVFIIYKQTNKRYY